MEDDYREELKKKFNEMFNDLLKAIPRDTKLYEQKILRDFFDNTQSLKKEAGELSRELTDRVMDELDKEGIIKELETTDFASGQRDSKALAKRIDRTVNNIIEAYLSEFSNNKSEGSRE